MSSSNPKPVPLLSLNFTPADLEANRQGRLSDDQRQRLDAEIKIMREVPWFTGTMRLVLVYHVLLLVVMMGIGFVNEYNSQGQDMSKALKAAIPAYGALLGVVTVCIVVILLIARFGSYGHIHPLVEGRVDHIDGTVGKIVNDVVSSWGKTYEFNHVWLKHGWGRRTQFPFSDEASLRYFREGDSCRIFYILYGRGRGGESRYPLSMEVLDEKN